MLAYCARARWCLAQSLELFHLEEAAAARNKILREFEDSERPELNWGCFAVKT